MHGAYNCVCFVKCTRQPFDHIITTNSSFFSNRMRSNCHSEDSQLSNVPLGQRLSGLPHSRFDLGFTGNTAAE
jgi:hypothetical protein